MILTALHVLKLWGGGGGGEGGDMKWKSRRMMCSRGKNRPNVSFSESHISSSFFLKEKRSLDIIVWHPRGVVCRMW